MCMMYYCSVAIRVARGCVKPIILRIIFLVEIILTIQAATIQWQCRWIYIYLSSLFIDYLIAIYEVTIYPLYTDLTTQQQPNEYYSSTNSKIRLCSV